MTSFWKISFLLIAAPFYACSAASVTDQSYGAGHWAGPEQMYEKSCAACHSTGIGPVIKGLPLPPEVIAGFVRNGVNTMPAFKTSELDDKELRSLAEWLAKTPAPASGATP